MSTLSAAGPPAAAAPRTAGWYGKLPALGDFASRRLPSEFVASWDRWLALSLASSREQLRDAWLAAYLTSPVWRFFLMPGALASGHKDGNADGNADHKAGGKACWSGVVMPSVDSVGRYFPLTIAAPFQAVPVRSDALADLWRWLGEIEQIALAVLRFDQPVTWLETQLALCSPPDVRPVHRSSRRVTPLDEFSVWAAPALDAPGEPRANPAAAHALWVAPGLPDARLFIAMLTEGRP